MRVVVRPGEAYIAPTEDVIHDGDTEAITTADVALTLLGRFRPKPIRLPMSNAVGATR